MASGSDPFTEIVEQPKSRDIRFRYECEGRTAGSIPGQNSTKDNKTFPSIRVRNYQGTAVIVVSCVSKSVPHYPHPHSLVGKTPDYECKHGVCTYKVKDVSQVIPFPNLGVQCAKKKELQKAMLERQNIRVDPFRTGYQVNEKDVDLNAVRLCWQVFLPDATGKFTRIVPPVVSDIIYDKKSVNDLVICRIDRATGSVRGGDEVFLLCDKVNKDDIEVRFYEEDDKGKLRWEGFGNFGATDVHHQVAIVFKTPPYLPPLAESEKKVSLHLRRPSTKDCSDPISFTYTPYFEDPDWVDERRKRKRPMLATEYGAGDAATGVAAPLGGVVAPDAKDRLRQVVMERHGAVKAEGVSAACNINVPATVLGVEPLSTIGQPTYMAESQHHAEAQPFANYSYPQADLPAPTSVTSSVDLPNSLFGISSQDLNAILSDPMLSDAGGAVGMSSQDFADPNIMLSINGTGSFSTSIGTALDQLQVQGGPAQPQAQDTVSFISTTSLETLLSQIATMSETVNQQQPSSNNAPATAGQVPGFPVVHQNPR